jgi:hypothetical protein
MTLKEISEHYQVQKFNGKYLLFNLNPKSCVRFNHKYLCQLEKVGNNNFKKRLFSKAQSVIVTTIHNKSLERFTTFKDIKRL